MKSNLEYFKQFDLQLNDLENNPELAKQLLIEMKIEMEIKRKNEEELENLISTIVNSQKDENDKDKYLETVKNLETLRKKDMYMFMKKINELKNEITESNEEREERKKFEKRMGSFIRDLSKFRSQNKYYYNDLVKSIVIKDNKGKIQGNK